MVPIKHEKNRTNLFLHKPRRLDFGPNTSITSMRTIIGLLNHCCLLPSICLLHQWTVIFYRKTSHLTFVWSFHCRFIVCISYTAYSQPQAHTIWEKSWARVSDKYFFFNLKTWVALLAQDCLENHSIKFAPIPLLEPQQPFFSVVKPAHLNGQKKSNFNRIRQKRVHLSYCRYIVDIESPKQDAFWKINTSQRRRIAPTNYEFKYFENAPWKNHGQKSKTFSDR